MSILKSRIGVSNFKLSIPNFDLQVRYVFEGEPEPVAHTIDE